MVAIPKKKYPQLPRAMNHSHAVCWCYVKTEEEEKKSEIEDESLKWP